MRKKEKQKERESKGGVKRRVCVRKSEEGEREGGWEREGEAERHRIRSTAQLQTAEAECPHG